MLVGVMLLLESILQVLLVPLDVIGLIFVEFLEFSLILLHFLCCRLDLLLNAAYLEVWGGIGQCQEGHTLHHHYIKFYYN